MKLNKDYIYLLEGCTPVSRYKLTKLIERHAETHDVKLGPAAKMAEHEVLEDDWNTYQGVYFIWKSKTVDLDKYRGEGLDAHT